MACKEIVYKNNHGNCITDDTGILTVSSKLSRVEQCAVERTFAQGNSIEIEFDYFEAINEEIGKFDEHLCAFTAVTLETKIKENIRKGHKKECGQCTEVFGENPKIDNDFLRLKSATSALQMPCKSTIDIIKAANKIFSLLEDKDMDVTHTYDSVLKTVMDYLEFDDLYSATDFGLHTIEHSGPFSHQEEFIYKIVNEYMKLKSRKIGDRIGEKERGVYIRHENRKRVHEAGQ